MKPAESKAVSPKPTLSINGLKKFLSSGKRCQPTSSVSIESIETTSNHILEHKEIKVKRAVTELDLATYPTVVTETASFGEKKPQCKVRNRTLVTRYLWKEQRSSEILSKNVPCLGRKEY